VNTSAEKVILRVLNPSKETKQIYKNMTIASVHRVEEVQVLEEQKRCYHVTKTPSKETSENLKIPEHLEDLWKESTTELNKDQQEAVKRLLIAHIDLFAKNKEDLGTTDLVQHEINTGDAKPIRQAARRLPIHQRQEEKEQVEAMLKRGIITESNSPWSSPVVLVRKKDQTWRYCLDYRKINDVTKKDSYPLPRIDDSLDQLSGARWFSTLDLQSGYWQVKMAPKDKEKTAFITSQGLFEFSVMPFGLACAPATFERLMERILKGLKWKTCLVYLDDVIIHGTDFEQSLQRLSDVFGRLRSAGLKVNPKKRQLFQPT
jgi:hypothetical protein